MIVLYPHSKSQLLCSVFIQNCLKTLTLKWWQLLYWSFYLWELYPLKSGFTDREMNFTWIWSHNFIIYAAMTRGEKFSAVEIFQLLLPKKIKQHKTTNLVTSWLEHMDSNVHCFFLRRDFFSLYGGQEMVLQPNTDLSQIRKKKKKKNG